MLSVLLKFWRIETKGVGTATQALSLIEAEHFDLYLLDTWLPDLDGVELCRWMRPSTRTRRFFSFPARPMKLIRREALKQEPMLT